MEAPWVRKLRKLHEENFFDWTSQLRDVNRQLNLVGPDKVRVPNAGLPPSWFVGDIEALQPGQWVLVISLNQRSFGEEDESWRREQRRSIRADWDFWRWLNRKTWYGTFYSPLVRLDATALGEAVPDEKRQWQEFATTRMVFVESCPYSSEEFTFSDADLGRLATTDRGFQIVAQVRQILIREARPALVMVNGVPAVSTLQLLEPERLKLQERSRYQSISDHAKRLRHWEGHFSIGNTSVPVLGFPFLRKPNP